MHKIYNTFLLPLAFVAILLLSSACSDDNSVNDDDKNTDTAIAENNTFQSENQVYELKFIGLFKQTFLNEVWLFVYSESTKDLVTVRISDKIPTSGTKTFKYQTSLTGIADDEFSITVKASTQSGIESWQGESDITGFKTTGNMTTKVNSNNTITFYFNNITLGDKNNNPTKTMKFSSKFTFSLDYEPQENANPDLLELSDSN